MNRLCFGTFAKILQGALQKPNSNQAVAELLLGLITDMASEGQISSDYSTKPKKISKLFNHLDEVHGDIISLASTKKVIDAMPGSIKSQIIPYLKPYKIEDMKEHLRRLISGDTDMAPVMRERFLSLSEKGQDCLAEFLSEIYLYALSGSNKDQGCNVSWNIQSIPVDFSASEAQRIKASQEMTKTPLNNLPHIRNPFFTGRNEKLKEIQDNFEDNDLVSLTQSVTGLGGIGKSSIALEYAYSNFNKYQTIWWVNAETEQTTLNSCLEFGQMKKIIKDDANSFEIIDSLKNWFNNNKNWLFIYDNADADHFKWLERYLPQIGNGNVLITTRSYSFPKSATINIEIFSDAEAVAFLKKRIRKTGKGFADDLAKDLAERLQCLPLALEQAAAFIEQTPGITYQDYITMFNNRGTDIFKNKVLIDYDSTVAITWNISMDKITNDSAIQMFYMCAYFASDKIPIDIFVRGNEVLPEPLKKSFMDDFARKDIINELARYSLLSLQNDVNTTSGTSHYLSMHRLLQDVVQKKIDADSKWLGYCVAVIRKSVDWKKRGKNEIDMFKLESPHVISIAEKAAVIFSNDNIKLIDVSMMFNEIGMIYYNIGDYEKALKYYHHDLEICEKVFGNYENQYIAASLNNIGDVYKSLGDYDKALGYFKKSLTIKERVLKGNEKSSLAISYDNIGFVYFSLGNVEKALEYYNKAVAIFISIYGEYHPDTAISYNHIGWTYYCSGEYQQALTVYEKALTILKAVYGLEHPETAKSIRVIGEIYGMLGEHVKAFTYLNTSLALLRAAFGEEHPDIALAYLSIGRVHYNLHEDKKALEFCEKALSISQKYYNESHPNICAIRKDIAMIMNEHK